ncbi:IS1/IS6 family transposase, partial [Candidatus Woesearchaeota archaeon]|nr:IS1/IS6 family transposase [Candidatus Woesearchaeota archaeon]
MSCPICYSGRYKLDGKLSNRKQRYKCKECGKRFCETTSEFFHRNRIPKEVLSVAILFHLFIPARIVQLFLFFFFRCTISKETICFWSSKFLEQMPEIKREIKDGKLKIRHTDEKFIKIGKELAYWVNTVDHQGRLLTSSILESKDKSSIKEHMGKHKQSEKNMDIHVTDKNPSYIKTANKFGRKCIHHTAGLKEKLLSTKNLFLFLSNLPVERLHSKIDAYINLKVRGSFTNIESAERLRKAFTLTDYLLETFALHGSLGTYPTTDNWKNPTGEFLF